MHALVTEFIGPEVNRYRRHPAITVIIIIIIISYSINNAWQQLPG